MADPCEEDLVSSTSVDAMFSLHSLIGPFRRARRVPVSVSDSPYKRNYGFTHTVYDCLLYVAHGCEAKLALSTDPTPRDISYGTQDKGRAPKTKKIGGRGSRMSLRNPNYNIYPLIESAAPKSPKEEVDFRLVHVT
jgi:hypothetical protein